MKPRKPRSILDQLEADGVIDSDLVKDLREFANGNVAAAPLLQRLMYCLTQLPGFKLSRARRDYALALEHAYLESVESRMATHKVAEDRGVSKGTVKNAVRRANVPEISKPRVRADWLCDSFDEADSEFRKVKVDNRKR